MEIIPTKAYGATCFVFNGLKPMTIERTPLQTDEVHIDVLYCGVCAQGQTRLVQHYPPLRAGPQDYRRIVAAGSAVTKFKTGDMMGVRCKVDACGTCSSCREGEENHYKVPWAGSLGRADCAGPKRHRLGRDAHQSKTGRNRIAWRP